MDDAWLWAAALALAVLVPLRNRLHIRRLVRWLDHGESPDPPRAYGAWDRLNASLYRMRLGNRAREAELQGALDRWREAARALPDGVVILEADRIAWCNDMARLHLDLEAARDVGTPLLHLVRIPELAAHLEAGDFARPLQARSPHQPDRVLSLQVVAYGQGQRLLLSRDITQLQAVERVRREFVANVSHELRTPLTVVSGFVETLRDERDPEAARRYLDLMAGQSGRMLRLVEDLLTLSTLESAALPALDEAIDMRGLLERLAGEARGLSAGRHRILVEHGPAPDLMGSEAEITSALGNLVSNAIRYTPDGGSVTLRWKAMGDDAVFEVQDTGIGIAAEHIPRLTERFYRVDRGRSRETGGTGLGLAIVKHALVRHGAALEVESRPGEGSLFRARFSGPRLRRAIAE